MEYFALWLLLWAAIFFVWGIWKATAAITRWLMSPWRSRSIDYRPVYDRQQDAQEAKRKKEREEVQNARREALEFYQEHATLLRSVYPPALFRTQLQVIVPEESPPDGAWAGSKELVAQLQSLVESEKGKQKQVEERQRARQHRRQRLQEEIDEFQRRVNGFRAAPMDRDIRQEEISALEERIRQVQREMHSIDEGGNHEATIPPRNESGDR